MPVYEYECQKCGNSFEVFQGINEEPRKRCPKCRGALRKVFTPVGIVFKGSGFYCTDNRSAGGNGSKKKESVTKEKEKKPAAAATDSKTDKITD